MATSEEKLKLKEWEEYIAAVASATAMEERLSEGEKIKKLAWLEDRPEEWMLYFFPAYTRYPFAAFQRKAIRRITGNPEWFEVLSWSRELAKSTVVMFCVMYLVLTQKKKNVILASATETSAERLLAPYLANFEANARIKYFYGEQMNPGQWTSTRFSPRCGASFLGIGAGNTPRGARNEAVRPDVLLVDDFDTDEDCRNPVTLQKKWDWWERALFPTRSVSEPTLIVFCGNIIAKDTCVARAGKIADHWDVVNIVDQQGKSSWSEKNSQEQIDRIRRSITTAAFQGEYMNNPVTEGKIFKNLTFAPVPPLKKFPFLLIYGDPAYSNTKKKVTSTKAAWLIGKLKQTFYVIRGFLARETNANYIEWFYQLREYVGDQTAVYCYQENNSLQDPFFEQVFQPLLREANQHRGSDLYIIGDTRKKPEKASRIEANLEPLDRNALLVFNSAEKDNPHMKELVDQFKLFELTLPYPSDGPDCIEGGIHIIRQKVLAQDPGTSIPADEFRDLNPFRM